MLKATPGMNIDEIAAKLGFRRTAANHHLRVLERSGAIVKVRQAGHQLHFTSETPRFERDVLCVLRVPSVRDVVRRLFDGHSLSSSALASSLNVTGRTTRRALKLLTTRGLLKQELTEGGRKIAHLHPMLRVLIAREMPASKESTQSLPNESHEGQTR
jgi:predicted transcriptional regulator